MKNFFKNKNRRFFEDKEEKEKHKEEKEKHKEE
jgi:hypothetical protein